MHNAYKIIGAAALWLGTFQQYTVLERFDHRDARSGIETSIYATPKRGLAAFARRADPYPDRMADDQLSLSKHAPLHDITAVFNVSQYDAWRGVYHPHYHEAANVGNTRGKMFERSRMMVRRDWEEFSRLLPAEGRVLVFGDRTEGYRPANGLLAPTEVTIEADGSTR